jgi:hypothetical protein
VLKILGSTVSGSARCSIASSTCRAPSNAPERIRTSDPRFRRSAFDPCLGPVQACKSSEYVLRPPQIWGVRDIFRDTVSRAGSADRDEVSSASVDARSVAKLSNLVNESDDEMGPKRLGEPAKRLHSRGVVPALDARDRGVACPHPLRQLRLAQPQLTPAAYHDPRQRLVRG